MAESRPMGRSATSAEPPEYVAAWAARFQITGYWMGWRWINGKAVAKAPPVER